MENDSYVILIGAGVEQIPLYQKAAKLGYRIAGVDINPQAPAFEHADKKLIINHRDAAQALVNLRPFVEKYRIAGVLTLAFEHTELMARLCQQLGLPGPSEKTAALCADIPAQIRSLRKQGVSVPRITKIPSVEHLESKLQKRRKPVIIKPADGNRHGRFLVHKTMDYRAAYRLCRTMTRLPYILMQEHNRGRLVAGDGFVLDGKVRTVLYSDRSMSQPDENCPLIVENGGSIPAAISPGETAMLNDLFQRAAIALGIENGPIHGQLVITSKGMEAIDFQPHVGGGYVSTLPLANGSDLIDINLLYATAIPVDVMDLTPQPHQYASMRFFLPKPGRVTAIYGVKELDEVPWIKYMRLYCKVGDNLATFSNHKQAGCVIVVGGSRDQAEERANEVVEQVRILTV